MSEERDRYRWISRAYYGLEGVYSLGAIRRCKLSQVRGIESGQRVLYAGVGGGEDALAAARAGAEVVGVDCSASMLRLARRRFAAAGVSAELVQGDVRDLDDAHAFDVVVANFFLNVFDEHEMPRMLQELVALLRPGGEVWIADFAPLAGAWWKRMVQAVYWTLPLWVFRWMTGNARHAIYDYRRSCRDLGLEVVGVDYFGVLGGWGRWFWTVRGVKREE